MLVGWDAQCWWARGQSRLFLPCGLLHNALICACAHLCYVQLHRQELGEISNYVHLSCCCSGLCGELGVVVQVVQTDCGSVLLICETSTGFSAASQYLVYRVQCSTGFLTSTTRICAEYCTDADACVGGAGCGRTQHCLACHRLLQQAGLRVASCLRMT